MLLKYLNCCFFSMYYIPEHSYWINDGFYIAACFIFSDNLRKKMLWIWFYALIFSCNNITKNHFQKLISNILFYLSVGCFFFFFLSIWKKNVVFLFKQSFAYLMSVFKKKIFILFLAEVLPIIETGDEVDTNGLEDYAFSSIIESDGKWHFTFWF